MSNMNKNDWIPVKTGKYPEELEDVQVTFIGYNDHVPHCEGFAYMNEGKWYWTFDDHETNVKIIAWKYNCAPYEDVEGEIVMDLQTKLYEKAKAEQDKFVYELLQKSSKEVMEAAYEKVLRDDILMIFENEDMDSEVVETLLKLEYPLAECYEHWLQSDCSHMDMLKDTVEDLAARCRR